MNTDLLKFKKKSYVKEKSVCVKYHIEKKETMGSQLQFFTEKNGL